MFNEHIYKGHDEITNLSRKKRCHNLSIIDTNKQQRTFVKPFSFLVITGTLASNNPLCLNKKKTIRKTIKSHHVNRGNITM